MTEPTQIYALFRVVDNRESYNESELLALSDDRAALERTVSLAAHDLGGHADIRFGHAGLRDELENLFDYRPQRDVYVIEAWRLNDLSSLTDLVKERADFLLRPLTAPGTPSAK